MASAKILTWPPSVDEDEDFDVLGSFEGCDSPTVTAQMNGNALAVSLTPTGSGTWTAVVTAGACEPGKTNTLFVTVKCGDASQTEPIAVNCS